MHGIWRLAAMQMHIRPGPLPTPSPCLMCICTASGHQHEDLQRWSGCKSGHDGSKQVILLLLVMFSTFLAMSVSKLMRAYIGKTGLTTL